MNPIYSICITNFNTEDSVKESIESIISQIDETFEVVVVDNCSNDASQEILREYERMHAIKLIVKKCSRGLGRQIAIENSAGKYIIGQMDLDDVFKPNLKRLLQIYHTNFEGCMLVLSEIIMVAPRKLIDLVGGFRDLNYLEERDLYARTAQIGYFRYLASFSIKDHEIKKKKKYSRLSRTFRQQYMMYREYFRIGEGTRSCYHAFIRTTNIKKRPIVFFVRLLVIPFAFVCHWFYPQFHNEFVNSFNESAYEVKLDNI